MNIESAQYKSSEGRNVSVTLVLNDDEETILSVPLDPNNRHYQAILAWAEEDGNEIQAAE